MNDVNDSQGTVGRGKDGLLDFDRLLLLYSSTNGVSPSVKPSVMMVDGSNNSSIEIGSSILCCLWFGFEVWSFWWNNNKQPKQMVFLGFHPYNLNLGPPKPFSSILTAYTVEKPYDLFIIIINRGWFSKMSK